MQARAAKHLILVYLKLISSGLLLSPKKRIERKWLTSRDIRKEFQSSLVTKAYSNHNTKLPYKKWRQNIQAILDVFHVKKIEQLEITDSICCFYKGITMCKKISIVVQSSQHIMHI